MYYGMRSGFFSVSFPLFPLFFFGKGWGVGGGEGEPPGVVPLRPPSFRRDYPGAVKSRRTAVLFEGTGKNKKAFRFGLLCLSEGPGTGGGGRGRGDRANTSFVSPAFSIFSCLKSFQVADNP